MYAKIDNTTKKVLQVQPYYEVGFVEVSDTVICGMIDNGDGTFSNPTPSASDIYRKKWEDYYNYQNNTAIDLLGNIYDITVDDLSAIEAFTISNNSLNLANRKKSVMTSTDSFVWIEDWGKFTVDIIKVETILKIADTILEAKINALGL